MLRRHIVLLIAIRLSDGDVKLGDPLMLFEKSRLWAGNGFHLLPSFHHHPTQHNYTTHTVTLTSTSYNTIQILVPHVMWSAQAVRDTKIEALPHSPTLTFLHLHHSSFSNPSAASPMSQALHLHHLASCPCAGCGHYNKHLLLHSHIFITISLIITYNVVTDGKII